MLMIFIYAILMTSSVCQQQINEQLNGILKYEMIAGKKSEYTFPMSQIGYPISYNISSSDISCNNSDKQYLLSSYDSSSMTGGASINLQHSIIRSFEQIEKLSSVADAIELNHQIYCLLMNGTLLIYKMEDEKSSLTLKNKIELSAKQLEIGKIIPIEIQNSFLILSREQGFKISGTDVINIQKYPKFMGSLTSATIIPLKQQIILATSFGNEGIKYLQLSATNQLIQIINTKKIVNQKLVTLQKTLNQKSQQFIQQAKDFRIIQSSTINDKVFLTALDSLKGVAVYQIKRNKDLSTLTQQTIYIDLHANRQGECQNLQLYGEMAYFSCQRVYQINMTQAIRVYQNVVSEKAQSNTENEYKSLAKQFQAKFQDALIIDMAVLNNFLILCTDNQFKVYWHRHYLGKYQTSNIQKVLLSNNQKGIRILLITPVSLFLIYLKPLGLSSKTYGNKFQCKSDPSLKSQIYQATIQIQKQCQNKSNKVCIESSKIAFQVTNQKDRDIMILIITIAVLCVLCIGGVIVFMLNQIRLINQKKQKIKRNKQYSNMLEEKQGYLQFQDERINSGRQQIKKQNFNQNQKQDNMKIKFSSFSPDKQKQYKQKIIGQKEIGQEHEQLDFQALKQSQTHL